jgi:glycosyltransferase involved in cell wall biosynthesis
MNLVVFLMRNTSLALYERMGMFDREMALYRELVKHGVRTALVTYGGREDLGFAGRLRGVRILCNWPGWPCEVYERRLVWLHAPWLWRADVVKADQTDGAEVAVWSARRWRKPVVARSGYSFLDFQERAHGVGSPQAREAERITRFVYGAARHVVVTTPVMAEQAVNRLGVNPRSLTVVPNYVDTKRFHPDPHVMRVPGRLCTIGRLEPEKNQAELIRALDRTGFELDIIGTGNEEVALRALAQERGAHVRFLGCLVHAQLPARLQQAEVFVLPSLYEGHPKTLLEAMACGTACVGTDVTGIREVIQHRETGILCGTSSAEIRESLTSLLRDPALRDAIGQKAWRFVEERFALDRVAVKELGVYRAALGHRKD